MCLEQWFWFASIIGGVATLGILVWTVISYGISNKKTRALIKAQAEQYEPNVSARLVETEEDRGDGVIYKGILFRLSDGLADVRIDLMNVSRVYAEFIIRIYVWMEEAGRKTPVPDAVVGDYYTGKTAMILGAGDIIRGHFFLNIKEWLGIQGSPVAIQRQNVAQKLFGDKLHLEISLVYTQEIKRKAPTFFDHYYARLSNTMEVVKADYAVVAGEWVFGGRSKTPIHPK